MRRSSIPTPLLRFEHGSGESSTISYGDRFGLAWCGRQVRSPILLFRPLVVRKYGGRSVVYATVCSPPLATSTRNPPKRLKRDPDSRIPIVPSADNIHLYIMGGHAGRFSATIPGWGHMSTPVLKPIDPAAGSADDGCTDGVCAL
jgi:hypothetical protein